MALHRHVGDAEEQLTPNPLLSGSDAPHVLPRLRIPEAMTPPEIAARLVRGDLILDGNARLNLATFVTTWMEPEARSLMAETFDKNMVDKDEYPQTAELEMRCVNILADLWHARADGRATGTSTTGSSEASMLGGMALLWRWRARRRAAGKPVDRPNLVTGINVQVCWEKFCRYCPISNRAGEPRSPTPCCTWGWSVPCGVWAQIGGEDQRAHSRRSSRLLPRVRAARLQTSGGAV